MSGNILNFSKRILEFRGDRYDAEKVLSLRLSHLWKQTRGTFLEEFGIVEEEEDDDDASKSSDNDETLAERRVTNEMLLKASAWYASAYDLEDYSASNTGLVSFPWVVADLLANLKKRVAASSGGSKCLNLTLGNQILAQRKSRDLAAEFMDISPAISDCLEQSSHLDSLIQVLMHWASEGRAFSNKFKRHMLAPLVLKFWRDHFYNPASSVPSPRILGKLCLKIIAYWGSQKFRNRRIISFPEFDPPNGRSLPALLPEDFRRLHEIAFETFHEIAVTGDFCRLFQSRRQALLHPKGTADVDEFEATEVNMDVLKGHTTNEVSLFFKMGQPFFKRLVRLYYFCISYQ